MTYDAHISVEVVKTFWEAAGRRDWRSMEALLAPRAIYFDIPLGRIAGAIGPDNVVARFRFAVEELAGYTSHEGVAIGDASHVMYEHSETWRWATGEEVTLPFVSVHQVVDGRISVWKDYWDTSTLYESAPNDWLAGLRSRPTPWLVDVRGKADGAHSALG